MDTRSMLRIMQDHLEEIGAQIVANMEKYGRNASRRSINSLRVDIVSDQEAILWGLTSFLVMEKGRKAGRVPRDFQSIIRQWIIDKGISVRIIPYKTNRPHKYSVQERSLRSAAGAIAYKIMTSGTRLHRQQGFDDIFTSAIDKELLKMYDEMLFVISLEVERIHQT